MAFYPTSINKFAVLLSLLGLVGAVAQADEAATAQRLDEVAERGAHVMPFALDKTRHIFSKTASGGIQQVIAQEAGDTQQLALIQQHLSGLAVSFAKGDFSGPAHIHGEAMPGLNALAAGAAQMQFSYQALPNGGQIAFVASKPELVAAVHRYFDAQLSDHARHAQSADHAMHHRQNQP